MKQKGAVLVETLVVLPVLGIIAGGVFILSTIFVRYIQVTSLTNEALRFANTPSMRNLPVDNSVNKPNDFAPIRNYVAGLVDAYKVFPTHNNAPGTLYIFDDRISNPFVSELYMERIRDGEESDILIRATVSAEQLIGMRFLPLPSITIESRGPYLYNQDLQ